MDYDIGPRQAIIDEVRCLMKEFTDIKWLVILGRDVEEKWNVSPRMANLHSFSSSQ